MDYIWGETSAPNSVIVSGGQNKERVCALIPFVDKAQAEDIPVIVLHTGNADLESMIQKYSRISELVSGKCFFYDVFRGMPSDDIAFLLYETMPSDSATPAAESLLRALIEVLLLTDGKITLHNLSSFPLITLKSKIVVQAPVHLRARWATHLFYIQLYCLILVIPIQQECCKSLTWSCNSLLNVNGADVCQGRYL